MSTEVSSVATARQVPSPLKLMLRTSCSKGHVAVQVRLSKSHRLMLRSRLPTAMRLYSGSTLRLMLLDTCPTIVSTTVNSPFSMLSTSTAPTPSPPVAEKRYWSLALQASSFTSYRNFFFVSCCPLRTSITVSTSFRLPTTMLLPLGLHATLILFPIVGIFIAAREPRTSQISTFLSSPQMASLESSLLCQQSWIICELLGMLCTFWNAPLRSSCPIFTVLSADTMPRKFPSLFHFRS
mmetsp:Transcript_27530/g.60951  ORF Transcript_27530/g.60951 Transcript_27530/m.60951 type:complete len:238 (-) Transcript_27530:209-922(-)